MSVPALVFYERVGHEGRRPSPFSWRVRFALAHKGLEAQVRTVRFADVKIIEELSGQTMVPVLVHGETVIRDSWEIVCYLETAFPDHPPLFAAAGGACATQFVSRWVDEQLHPVIRDLVLPDFIACLDVHDRAYYRSSREQLLGTSLESFTARRSENRAALNHALKPLEAVLSRQRFVGGDELTYGDYVVLAAFQWARLGCPTDVLDHESIHVRQWRELAFHTLSDIVDEFALHPAI